MTFVGVSRSVKKTTTPSGIGKRECCHFLGDLRSSKRGLLNTTLGKISSKCDNFFAGNSTSTSSIENHGNRIGCLLSYWVQWVLDYRDDGVQKCQKIVVL